MSSLSLRLPESIHRKVRELAKRDGVSINQFIATAVAEKTATHHDVCLPGFGVLDPGPVSGPVARRQVGPRPRKEMVVDVDDRHLLFARMNRSAVLALARCRFHRFGAVRTEFLVGVGSEHMPVIREPGRQSLFAGPVG